MGGTEPGHGTRRLGQQRRNKRGRVEVGRGCQCGAGGVTRRCVQPLLRRMACRFPGEANESCCRLELLFVSVETLELEAESVSPPCAVQCVRRDVLEQAAERAADIGGEYAAGTIR